MVKDNDLNKEDQLSVAVNIALRAHRGQKKKIKKL
jgi:hypothetical protein